MRQLHVPRAPTDFVRPTRLTGPVESEKRPADRTGDDV